MNRRYRDGEFSWREWYVAIRGRQDDDPNTVHARYLPTCTNCGGSPEASADPIPERCPECWARLQAVKS
jgi:hypothetical protein